MENCYFCHRPVSAEIDQYVTIERRKAAMPELRTPQSLGHRPKYDFVEYRAHVDCLESAARWFLEPDQPGWARHEITKP